MSEVVSEFEKISQERKEMVAKGEVPDWYITQGYLMFTRKYAYNGETVRGCFNRIATTLAKHVEHILPNAKDIFFELLWSGKLAGSTPVLSNTGTDRGDPVSCSGGDIGDSVLDFYEHFKEVAVLSKYGYGCSGYFGNIRHRGAPIATGGVADGPVEVLDRAFSTVKHISQGENRRGNYAGYFEADTPDFKELIGYVHKNKGFANIGWNFRDEFIQRLVDGDKEAISRWNDILYTRAADSKGYITKPDHAQRLAPEAIKNSGISLKGSNMCSEIWLPQDKEHTFSCVLSSLNLAKWDEITDDDIFYSIIFLDCVVEEMLQKARGRAGFEKIVRFTEKSRALGLGCLGFHSYLQSKMLAFEDLETILINRKIFDRIDDVTMKATQWLAEKLGEPEWCKGTGQRNATRMAIAPNTSSALLCGGVSQGIEPYVTNAYNQATAAGEMTRMNPYFVKLAKKKGKYSVEMMRDIAINHEGSVQHLDWLTDREKLVFRTAFEIDQMAIIRLASQRQKNEHLGQKGIDQGQSLNLFFGEDEQRVAEVVQAAVLDENIKGLYYQRSQRGIKGSKGLSEESTCVNCEG